jgi:NodT family efflux transporter outer membrane factor (OMF) lipoprotein
MTSSGEAGKSVPALEDDCTFMHYTRRLGLNAAPLLALAVALVAFSTGAAPRRLPTPPLPVAFDGEVGGSGLVPARLDHWWLLFNDASLVALEDEAFRTGPDARTAAARVLEAKATRDGQVAQTLPTGSIAGMASKEHQSNIGGGSNALFPIGGDYESETLNLKISWEIDLFGRLSEARKVAKADLAATRFNIEGARAALAANVADTYFQAAGLTIQIADAVETVRIQTELQQIAQQKADLGLGAASDADRVSADLSQAQAQLQDLQSQFHTARRQLLVLIGRRNASVESVILPTEVVLAPAAPATLPSDLLGRRPDVRESEQRLRAALGTSRLRHLAIFPTVSFLPQLGLSRSVQPSVGFNPNTQALSPIQQTTSIAFTTLGGGITIPLFNIPQLLFEAKAEDARTRQAAIAYEKTVETAYGEAENALVSLAAARRAAAVLADGEARARRASEAARTRYSMGLDDLTSTLSAEQAWRSTRAALTSERAQTLRRAVTTYKALGGGWAYTTLAKAP